MSNPLNWVRLNILGKNLESDAREKTIVLIEPAAIMIREL